ncbi:MAG: ORF6C domain-containing protein [Clostridium sp.]|uniref:ORF6C domain-containing protein n=1 Tax=Clostridium sp. TaxID=1506 RepID=UPI002A807D4D|nr:ORF6C domain-containing protein [Clostridium sp.]MCI6692540.1 ORF6C domain-containing protein [Clostridium sp.]MDY4252569.1 ORF6C domain-containing protein [Clostridium sp.]
MSNLKQMNIGGQVVPVVVNGMVNVEGMKFHDIEGGFGEGKKAMLVKEIAEIHGRELKDINRNINNNIKRFKKSVDIVDLKNGGFDSPLQELGFTTRDISISNNIYILSERGYAKLLKILEDDVAWEQYEKLVDGYFNMRKQIPKMSKELQAILMLDEKTVEMDNRIAKLENNMTIDYAQQEELRELANKKATSVLGGPYAPAYKELNKKVFANIWGDYKRIMQANSYKNTPVKNFELGRKTIIEWQPHRDLALMIKGCNAQLRM